jgi:hypothetical protein
MNDLSASQRCYTLALQMNPIWESLGLRWNKSVCASTVLQMQCFQNALKLQPEEEAYYQALKVALECLFLAQEALAAYLTELRIHPGYSPAREAITRLSHASINSPANTTSMSNSQ